ncbi:uncharacterized protein [Onthophagus taurus]|uniref:uncharacterized protein n=1 Tax=Onthophagus taurus TaxID=166361 RepID=UPI0039BE5F7B
MCYVTAKGIDIDVLAELTINDIDHLIPAEQFGLRIIIIKKLFVWKQLNGLTTPLASTITASNSSSSTVNNWINANIIDTDGNGNPENQPIFKLENLLLKSVSGQLILSEYKVSGLSSKNRNILTTIIVEDWLASDTSVDRQLCQNVAKEIKNLFPLECEVTYLGTKKQRGKLIEKYYSLRKKYKHSLSIGQKRKTGNVTDAFNEADTDEETFDINTFSDYKWLKNNYSPNDIVFEKWISTFNVRQKDVRDKSIDVFTKWPILKQNIAVALIELDFKKLHPKRNTLLFSKWTIFETLIKNIYHRDIKDKKSRTLFNLLQSSNLNEDSKNYLLIINLNAILIPAIIRTGQDIYRPTILDGQESFAYHLKDKSFIQSFIKNRKEVYEKNHWTLQPLILGIGKTIESLECFYIYVNDILYEVESFLKAVSVTFQLYIAFNLE